MSQSPLNLVTGRWKTEGGIATNNPPVSTEGTSVSLSTDLFGSVRTIDSVHARVHEGRYFSGGYYNLTVADAASIVVLVQTTSVVLHVKFGGACGGNALATLYEGTTVSNVGTTITMANHNRLSSKIFSGTVTHTPTITGNGTQVNGVQFIPGGSKLAGGGSSFVGFNNEMILAPNTNYSFHVTNISGATNVAQIDMECYTPSI